MQHNFRTASRSAADTKSALEALNADFISVMTENGVSGLSNDATFKMRAAQLIRETIVDTFAMSDPTPLWLERRSANLGDKIEFATKHKTTRVVKYAPGSQPLIFSPVKSKYTISTSMFELAYGIELQKVLTRQYEISDFVEDAAAALVRHNVELGIGAINAACFAGSTDLRGRALRTVLGTADVDKATVDAALRRMGPGTTIFGQRYALDPIFTFGATQSLQTQEELHLRGLLGTYRGANIVQLTDDYNIYQQAFTKIAGKDWEKLIFIAQPAKGGVLLERDLSPLNWEEVNAEKAIFRSSIRMDHGIFIDKPYNFHVIELA